MENKDQASIREELRRKVQDGVDKIVLRSYGSLDEMEEAVGQFKAEIGRETLERLIALKKNESEEELRSSCPCCKVALAHQREVQRHVGKLLKTHPGSHAF